MLKLFQKTLKFFFFNVYFLESGGGRGGSVQVEEGQKKGETEDPKRLCADSREPDVEFEPTECDHDLSRSQMDAQPTEPRRHPDPLD